jgi:hypothetical protein
MLRARCATHCGQRASTSHRRSHRALEYTVPDRPVPSGSRRRIPCREQRRVAVLAAGAAGSRCRADRSFCVAVKQPAMQHADLPRVNGTCDRSAKRSLQRQLPLPPHTDQDVASHVDDSMQAACHAASECSLWEVSLTVNELVKASRYVWRRRDDSQRLSAVLLDSGCRREF